MLYFFYTLLILAVVYIMESETVQQAPQHSSKKLENLSFYVLIGMVVIIPLFFVPSLAAPLQFSKTMLALVLAVIAGALIVLQSLKKGSFTYSWSLLHLSMWLLPLTYLLSSIFSSQPSLSFLGYELNTNTFGFILFGVCVAHIASLILSSKGRVFSMFVALLIASWGVFAFQIVQVVFGGPFPFLPDPVSNLIGRWNDFGLFAGFIGALILFATESLPLSKKHYFILAGTFVVTLISMMFVDLTEVWILFGFASFVALVLGLSRRFLAKEEVNTMWPAVLPALGFVVTLVFLMFGSSISTSMQSAASINAFEVRPNFQSTMSIMNSVYAEDPLFGSGPNTFASQWLLYRSSDIVQTPFWNVSFNVGSGTILSAIATSGIGVALAWLFFIAMLFITIGRAFFTDLKEKQAYVVISLSALSIIYLIAAHVLYAASQSLTLLLFLFIGVFIASITPTLLIRERSISLKGSPRAGLAFLVISVMVIMFAVASTYIVGKKYVSAYYHNASIIASNNGDLDTGLRNVQAALNLNRQDRYYRTMSLISLAQLNQIVQSNDSSDAAQQKFQTILARAIQNTNIALQMNPRSFSNMMARGLVFESVVPLQIEGAFDNAVLVYEAARVLNPHDPEIDWRLAQLNTTQGNTERARELITQALSKKADYTNAILLLAQIELNDGNLDEAIDSVRSAVFFEPQNSVLLYQLGILLVQDRSFTEAATAFEAALDITPDFANAAFFLAQTYASLERFDESAQLLERLIAQNPDNETLPVYLSSVQEEVNPFDGVPVAPETDDEVIE